MADTKTSTATAAADTGERSLTAEAANTAAANIEATTISTEIVTTTSIAADVADCPILSATFWADETMTVTIEKIAAGTDATTTSSTPSECGTRSYSERMVMALAERGDILTGVSTSETLRWHRTSPELQGRSPNACWTS